MTQWTEHLDAARRIEIGEPSLVKPDAMIEYWRLLNQPYVVVKNDDEWLLFLIRGGNALLERHIAENNLVTAPVEDECISATEFDPGRGEFIAVESAEALRTAPTPKTRMKVLNRDGRRCRFCGRSPANRVDLELHTHHIRPWSSGGLTIMENLLTLCQTCHTGLDPHFDRTLFDHVPREDFTFEDSVIR